MAKSGKVAAENAPQDHDMTDNSAAMQPNTTPQEEFEDLYLRQATKEFSDDLEKLRTAGDFKGEKTVQILIDALKQGTSCFTKDEKQRLARR